jgi:hypothetical protein
MHEHINIQIMKHIYVCWKAIYINIGHIYVIARQY